MDVFLEQVAELCRDERTAPKWVLLRDARLALAMGERLVRTGTDWVNLRCRALYHLALDMAAPYLLERGVDPTPEGLGPALALRLLEDLPPGVPRHFRPLAEQPRIGDTLWRTLHEVRMAGLSAADLRPDNPRLAEFQAVLRAYEEHLEKEGLADRAAVYREALQHAGEGPVTEDDLVLAAPEPTWHALERYLLEALPGRHQKARVLRLPSLEPPRRLPANLDWLDPRALTDADRLAWASAPAAAPQGFHDGTLDLFVAGGREAEVEEVLRRVLEERLPLDEVEIALASPDLAPLVWEELERHGLPGTMETGVPALLTRPGQGLNGFLRWVQGGFVAWDLRRWLLSGTVRDAADGARLLERSLPTWGRDTYARAFRAERTRLEARAADPHASPERREAMRAQGERLADLDRRVSGLLERIPQGDRVPMAPWVEACRHVVEDMLPTETPLDRAARARILGALDELRGVGEQPRPLEEAVRMVRERLEELAVSPARSGPGALHVSLLSRAAASGRQHLFVLGLEEGHFRGGTENPVLFDEERTTLSEYLPTSEDRVTEAVWAAMSRLAAAGGRVTMSFSCRDLRDARNTPPSWPFVHAARLLWSGVDSLEALMQRLGEPRTVVPSPPSRALAPADWWLARLRGLGRAALPRVREEFPALDRGLRAEADRDSREVTEFTGLVPSAAGRYDPRGGPNPVSASRLEDLGACPFRFFLRYVLNLSPLELAPPQPDRWLDAAVRGKLLHEVFALYRRELRDRLQAPRKEDASRLQQLLDERLGELQEELPPVSAQMFEYERDALRGDVQRFLSLELKEPDREPVALEVSFGMPTAEGEPLDRDEPVALVMGHHAPFRLRGRIDRIDRLSDGTYQVLDYKTGSDWDARNAFHGGRKLQFALYALAARELLRPLEPEPRVVGSVYYHPTEKAREAWHERPVPNPERLGRLLELLLYPVREGIFLQTDTEDDCAFCDFRAVCGLKPWERARRKNHEARRRMEELRGHE